MKNRTVLLIAACLFGSCTLSSAGDAPQWMHTAASAPVPDHDEKTAAVLLYSEKTVNVQSLDKIKTHVREVYKILRPTGREYGFAAVSFNSHKKVSSLHG